MKHLKTLFIICLVLLISCSSLSVFASKSKAEKFSKQGDDYAAQDQWDLAADAYAQAVKEFSKNKDYQVKFENACNQAAAMLIQKGDEANSKEQFDEAITNYKKALIYLPNSIEAKAKLDKLSQEMVAQYYKLGRTYESQNQWSSALKEYEKAYAINPNYLDLAESYKRAKAKVDGKASIRAILFYVNRGTQFKIENPLIQALQAELIDISTKNKNDDIVMIDRKKVQTVIDEQAGSLSDEYNDALAMDLGRILAANDVIVGEILPDGKNKVKIITRLLKVPEATLIKEVKISYDLEDNPDWDKEVLKLAKEIAPKMTAGL
jgi:tetratricopeptide (TPR) repeat protein